MKEKTLWLSWLYLYILCAILGFIPEPNGLIKALMVLFSVLCFVPGFLLARRGWVRQVRTIAMAWLVTGAVLLVLNILSVIMPPVWGDILYYVMVVAASPMVCGQYWVVSLFLGACLLMYAVSLEKNRE